MSKNRPYHGMFRLSDDTGSGLTTLDVFRHTLNMLGARLTQVSSHPLLIATLSGFHRIMLLFLVAIFFDFGPRQFLE